MNKKKRKYKNIYLNILTPRDVIYLLELGYSDKEIISSFKLRGSWAEAVHLLYDDVNNPVSI